MEKFDVIVIGSGIGGLISAGMFASHGLKTLVLEKHIKPGGYLSSFTRKGFIFDSAVDCVSGVAPGGLIHRVLEMLDVDGDVRFLRIDPIRVSRFPDLEIPVDANVEAYKERLISLFPSETSEIRLFFESVVRAYGQLQSALKSLISGSANLSALTPDLLRLIGISYGQMLDEYFSDFRLKAVLSDRCPFIGLPPSKVSAVAMINMIMSYFDLGAYRPEGGFQRLADAFIEGIRRKGGEVIFGNGVKRIILNANNICLGVRCDNGEKYMSRHIISNVDFDLTFRRLLGGRFIRLADDMMRDPGISTSFFIIYAGISGESNMHSSLGYFPSFNMEGFFDSDMEISGDSTIGVTMASIEDKSRAPYGCNTLVLHEMIEASGLGLDKAACIDRTIKKAEKIFPELKNIIEVLDAATPSTLQRYTGNCGGSAFGWRQIPGFRGPKRHGIENLHIAGHWGDFGGGVLAAAYSGAKAAGEVLSKEGIKNVI